MASFVTTRGAKTKTLDGKRRGHSPPHARGRQRAGGGRVDRAARPAICEGGRAEVEQLRHSVPHQRPIAHHGRHVPQLVHSLTKSSAASGSTSARRSKTFSRTCASCKTRLTASACAASSTCRRGASGKAVSPPLKRRCCARAATCGTPFRTSATWATVSSRARTKLAEFASLIASLRTEREHSTVSELVQKVLDRTSYQRTLEEENTLEAQSRLENIGELITAVRQFEAESENPSLQSFLEQVSLVSDIDSLDANAEAVTLMTLHAAKGLEFPDRVSSRHGGVRLSSCPLHGIGQGVGGGAAFVLCGHHAGQAGSGFQFRQPPQHVWQHRLQPAVALPQRDTVRTVQSPTATIAARPYLPSIPTRSTRNREQANREQKQKLWDEGLVSPREEKQRDGSGRLQSRAESETRHIRHVGVILNVIGRGREHAVRSCLSQRRREKAAAGVCQTGTSEVTNAQEN